MNNHVSIDQYRALQRRNTDLSTALDKVSSDHADLKLASKKWRRGYDFYMMIQQACQNSPAAAMQLEDLLITCRLSSDEEQPGLTSSLIEAPQYDLFHQTGVA